MAFSPSLPPLSQRLLALARLFLWLGTIGFGGPQAHIAMMNDAVVTRRQWLTVEQFTEGLAICEMLPGPASTQMGIYCGYVWAGQLGALLAGFCFIAPAFLILLVFSWAYFRFQALPQIGAIFLGVSPVVVAIIWAFCWKLGHKTLKDWKKLGIAIAVCLLTLLSPVSVILQFLIAGILGIWLYRPLADSTKPSVKSDMRSKLLLPLWGSSGPLFLAKLPSEPLALASFWGTERIAEYGLPLALFFLKVGSFIFGGGLVIIPLLETAVVNQLGWLTHAEFINGVAIGQITPGPVVLTAAFVGYKVAGVLGALVATVGMFAPSFAFIMLASPLLQTLRQQPWVKAFLAGVMPAVLGAIMAASLPLLRSTLGNFQDLGQSLLGLGIGGVALWGLVRYQWPTGALVPAGAGVGLLAGVLMGS